MKWLKKLKDIVDPNYWAAEKIGNKSGLYDKAKSHQLVNGR